MKTKTPPPIGKRELASLYQTKTTAEIAALLGVNPETVRKRMIALGIARRSRGGRRTFNPNPDELAALYQQHSMKEIGRMFDVGETVVWNRLKEFGITLKDYEDGGHRKKPGRTFSVQHRKALSRVKRGKWAGEKNPHWRGGVHAVNIRLRQSGEYKQWKYEAKSRVGFACQECGVKDGTVCECCGTKVRLHVHHVLSFSRHPAKRFDPTNSEVLCPKCHHSRHHGKTG